MVGEHGAPTTKKLPLETSTATTHKCRQAGLTFPSEETGPEHSLSPARMSAPLRKDRLQQDENRSFRQVSCLMPAMLTRASVCFCHDVPCMQRNAALGVLRESEEMRHAREALCVIVPASFLEPCVHVKPLLRNSFYLLIARALVLDVYTKRMNAMSETQHWDCALLTCCVCCQAAACTGV